MLFLLLGSHNLLPGPTLHLDFMMCLKNKVNCFGRHNYWYLFHQISYLGTAPLGAEGGSESSSIQDCLRWVNDDTDQVKMPSSDIVS